MKTLGKLDTAKILVRETLDKLGPIKPNLIRTDPDWHGFMFKTEKIERYAVSIANRRNTAAVSVTR